ncbi:multicopper oxidase family protein [Profundibacter sp.]|uniref:multicopper oxidase family protein n=1 Tax=Profundibacter sp. TaxID=3101071 RepID=UPI003D0D1F47
MRFSRRQFINSAAAVIATPALIGRAIAATGGRDLPIPDVLDLSGGGGVPALDAMAARTEIMDGAKSVTVGYGQGFLGPVIRMKRGETARLNLGNRIKEPVTVHWHEMHIDGAQDGGPHSPVDTGGVLEAALDIDQPAATLWYHSHIHQRTGIQVYYGLAGMLIIDDPDAADSGLPQTYGVDDIPLVVQDRIFDRGGQMLYAPQGPTRMMGYRGSEILVNGAIRPRAIVPAGLVRLRILNGSNARIYHFTFEDGRVFHQVASDGGLLPMPVAMNTLTLAPAERVEIVVDFSAGATRLLSAPDTNMGMMGGGMMGGMMRGASPEAVADGGVFEVMSFAVDNSRKAPVTTLAKTLAGAPIPEFGEPVRHRRFALNMGMGMGMMRGGGSMAINGKSMDMAVINQELKSGEAEIWEVSTEMMAHPFHVHGTSFQVLTLNGRKVDYTKTGLKDVVLVDGTAELLVQVNRKADAKQPFMFHCHILEHEDMGMMGQFTVS